MCVGMLNIGCGVSLETVMCFFSGAANIPPSGYDIDPTILFSRENLYPTASTCALQLTLPTRYHDYNTFKKALDSAFVMHGGFGLS